MGGKKGQTSTSTVYQQQLPEYARPYFESLMLRAADESRVGHTSYDRARLARFAPEERMAQAGVRSLAAAGPRPELGFALGQYGSAAGSAADTGTWNEAAYAQYANPYTQNVIDIEKREAARQGAIEQRRIGAESVGAGAYGGYREGIQEAALTKDLSRQLQDIQTTGGHRGYTQALGAWQADQERKLMGAEVQAKIAEGYEQLARTQQNQMMERLAALEQVGVGQREMHQVALDMAYQDWLELQNWEKNQISYLGGILHGVPVKPDQYMTATSPGPAMGSQIAGGAMAGLGGVMAAYNAYDTT